MSLGKLELGYPEILLSMASFLFLFLRRRRRGSSVLTNWPLLGMLPGLISRLHCLHDWTTEVLRESGCTFLFKGPWCLGMDSLMTSDPANIRYIFNSHFSNYPRGSQFCEIDIFGDALINADSDSWKSHRKVAHSLMSEPRFRCFVTKISSEKVEKVLVPLLARAAGHAATVDLQDVFSRFTFDTTCNMAFGVDPGFLSPDFPSVPFAKALDDAEEVLFFRHIVPMGWWKLLRWLQVGEEKKMALALETIDNFIAGRISERMEEVAKVRRDKGTEEELAPDLLTSYLGVQHNGGNHTVCPSKIVRDSTLGLMVVGRDTTATALTWFFWVVSQHPEVERKILDELKPIMAGLPESRRVDPVVFDADDLSSAVYLKAALCESLRLFPPVPFEHKNVLRPDVLPSGHKVDPKTKIFFYLYSMARMEGIWGKDCREFKPERWISDGGKLKHEPSYKFFSFASGPRICLGKDMAFAQLKVVAATLLQNFRIKVVQGHVVAPSLSIVLHMKNGLKVSVEKRV